MCLAQAELARCHMKWDERGPGCEFHDLKVLAADQEQDKPEQPVVYVGNPRRQRRETFPTSST
jgi:hypothetical protein